nr:uncharacterized protein LOC113715966 [Coffea arabica]
MPGSPIMNGVTERRNRTLKDMDPIPEQDHDIINQDNVEEQTVMEKQTLSFQETVTLRRSIRERRNAVLDDYIIFLQEHEDDSGLMEDDPINFRQVMESSNSQKWIDATNEEIKSIKDNDVWDLVTLSEGAKLIGLAHFDLELHQMDVKIASLNGNIDETIYMVQPKNFVSGDPKNIKTKDYMLTYRKSDELEIIGYTDSDYARCQDTMKSTLGYIYSLARGAISWKSAKQFLIASSIMATEFITCYETSNQGIWLRNFVTGLRVMDSIETPLKLFCDNKSAILYSNNNRSSKKSKHIDIKFLTVKEREQSEQLSIEYIGTNFMVADPLTKGLPPKIVHEHTVCMGVMLLNDVQF